MRVGDPDDEVLGAWLAKESVRDVYLTEHPDDAGLLLDKAIEGCRLDQVPEIRSLGRTLARWRTEILNHHTTGASNGPTEGLNLLVKKVKRAGHGFRSFVNYRLRILLHAGGVDWPASRPPAPRIRTRSPTETGRAGKAGWMLLIRRLSSRAEAFRQYERMPGSCGRTSMSSPPSGWRIWSPRADVAARKLCLL